MFQLKVRSKLSGLLFTGVLALSMQAPGLVSSAQDVPTLDYYFGAFQYKPDGLTAVENAANDILVKEIGAKVKLHPLGLADLTAKGPLILSSGQQCDLMSFSQFNPFSPAIASGGLAPIGDLIKQYAPKTYSNFPPDNWNAVTKDGKIYGAPVFVGGVSKAAMWVRADLVAKYNFDWKNATKITDWEPFFDAVLKGENGNVIPLLSSDPYWGRQWWPNLYGYDPISESIGAPGARGMVGVKLDDPTTTVVPVAFTPEYKQAVELARKWYLKGYFLKSVPSDTEMSALRGQLKFAAFEFPGASNSSTNAMSGNEWNGVPILTGFFQDKTVITTGKILSSVYGVCAVSQHPTEAVKFIEAMNTNVDLLNLFNYGIQGKDWVWKDQANKVITYPPGVDGNTVSWNPNTYWQFGDKRLVYLTTPDDIGVLDRDAADLKVAIISPILGFVPDLSTIQNEVAQIATTAKEYCDPVDRGLVDVDTGLKQCQDQLKAAGIDTIVAELQRQINTWKAANSGGAASATSAATMQATAQATAKS